MSGWVKGDWGEDWVGLDTGNTDSGAWFLVTEEVLGAGVVGDAVMKREMRGVVAEVVSNDSMDKGVVGLRSLMFDDGLRNAVL